MDLNKYNSIVTDLYIHYGENEELDKLIDDITDETRTLINEIKPLLLNKLICPKCNDELTPSHYQGYYEEFSYWKCSCKNGEEHFTKNTFKGAYR